MSASQFPPLQSKPSTKHCSNCSAKMALYSLPGHYDSTVEIDVCMACNAIWFDQFESMQLSPDGTVALFQLIHQSGSSGSSASTKFSEGLRCVTCGDGMKLTNDQVKGTRFSYQACRKGHGRFTTFYNFLAEKQFVRELTQTERAKLAATVQQLRCSGCGAAVNIGKVDACEYCRAPVSVFDREAAKKAIDHYLQERKQQPASQANSSNRREAGRSADMQWSAYDRADLGSDILYALGRAATRGLSGTGRTASGTFAGAGASSVFADSSAAASALPDATSALFGADLASGASGASGELASGVSDALPSATHALFGAVSGSAGDAATGLTREFAGVFSDGIGEVAAAGAAGLGESAASVVADLGGGAVEVVGEAAGELASSVGGGAVDLVVDGIGSLLGALFD